MSPVALTLILCLFLAAAGFIGLVVGRTLRSGRGDLDAAGWVIVLALGFAASAIVTLELVLPRLEALLLHR